MKQLTYDIDAYAEGLTPRDLKTELGIGGDTSVRLETLFDLLDSDERQMMKLLFGLGPRQHGEGVALSTICLFHLHMDEVDAQRRLDLALQKLRRVVGTSHFRRAVGVPDSALDPYDLMQKASLSTVERQILQKLYMLSGGRKYTVERIVDEFGDHGFSADNVRDRISDLMARLRAQVAV